MEIIISCVFFESSLYLTEKIKAIEIIEEKNLCSLRGISLEQLK
jgi:hypothetical protein